MSVQANVPPGDTYGCKFDSVSSGVSHAMGYNAGFQQGEREVVPRVD